MEEVVPGEEREASKGNTRATLGWDHTSNEEILIDGYIEGETDGTSDGTRLGLNEGWLLGIDVGLLLGAFEGLLVGDDDGINEGETDGTSDGIWLGMNEGWLLGINDGASLELGMQTPKIKHFATYKDVKFITLTGEGQAYTIKLTQPRMRRT